MLLLLRRGHVNGESNAPFVVKSWVPVFAVRTPLTRKKEQMYYYGAIFRCLSSPRQVYFYIIFLKLVKIYSEAYAPDTENGVKYRKIGASSLAG